MQGTTDYGIGLVLLFSFALLVPAYAESDKVVQDSSITTLPIYENMDEAVKEFVIGDKAVLLPFVEITAEDGNSTQAAVTTVITAALIRNGNTKYCEVLLVWSGYIIFNEWRLTNCIVDNGGIGMFNVLLWTNWLQGSWISGS